MSKKNSAVSFAEKAKLGATIAKYILESDATTGVDPKLVSSVAAETVRVLSEFLKTLQSEGQLENFEELLGYVFKALYKDIDDKTIYVKSPIKLSKQEQATLERKLKQRFPESTSIHYVIDNMMLGGIIIIYQDTIIDLSVERRIHNLRNALRN